VLGRGGGLALFHITHLENEEGEGVMENENRAPECCMIDVCGWVLCVEQCGNSARFFDVAFLNLGLRCPMF